MLVLPSAVRSIRISGSTTDTVAWSFLPKLSTAGHTLTRTSTSLTRTRLPLKPSRLATRTSVNLTPLKTSRSTEPTETSRPLSASAPASAIILLSRASLRMIGSKTAASRTRPTTMPTSQRTIFRMRRHPPLGLVSATDVSGSRFEVMIAPPELVR